MKRFLALLLVVAMVFAIAIPAMAKTVDPYDKKEVDIAANKGDGKSVAEGFSFHCNDIEGSNGRTYVGQFRTEKKNGNGWDDANTNKHWIALESAGGTKWTPVIPAGHNWACVDCGRTDWVTFSNNSGVPDGKNAQFQHDGPSRRWITIRVIYHIDIPECEFTCVNDGAECEFECTCEVPCPNAGIGDHDNGKCTMECGVDHDCDFDGDLTCGTVCECEKKFSEVIVNRKELIKIADGYVFSHTALPTWEGGKYVRSTPWMVRANLLTGAFLPITETLYGNTTWNFYYEGKGACECECDLIECDAECLPCGFTWSGHEGCCFTCYTCDGDDPYCDYVGVCDGCPTVGACINASEGCKHNCNPKPPHECSIAVCDICKDGKGGNCVGNSGTGCLDVNCVHGVLRRDCTVNSCQSNTNFFCIECGTNIGGINLNNGNQWGIQGCYCDCHPHDNSHPPYAAPDVCDCGCEDDDVVCECVDCED